MTPTNYIVNTPHHQIQMTGNTAVDVTICICIAAVLIVLIWRNT